MPAQVFLVLFPAGVGCLLGSLILDPGFAVAGFSLAGLTVALVFALDGALSPVSGIRRPGRSYRFLSGVGRSPLSRQALLVGLFGILLLIYWALALARIPVFALGVVAALVGGAAVVAIGLTYWLPSQPAWRHWSTFAFLLGGTLAVGVGVALVVALAWPDSLPAGSAAVRAAQALVLIGSAALGVATIGRSVYLARGGSRTAETWALTQSRYRREHLAAGALVAVALVASAVAFAWPWAIIIAIAAAVAAQVFEWRLFFVTQMPLTWRNEVTWSLPPSSFAKEG